MSNLEELLELTKFLEKESKDVNMNDISQVISFLKKYIDCQNKIINAFKENYDRKTIELSKYEQALEILKDKIQFEDLGEMQSGNIYRGYFNDCFNEEEYKLLKEVFENDK